MTFRSSTGSVFIVLFVVGIERHWSGVSKKWFCPLHGNWVGFAVLLNR